MAYDSNTKKVTAPIRVGDVADALGESSFSIGALCSSDAVNMWAKYKPVQCANWGILTEAERKSANFGIVVSGYDPSASLDSNMSKMHQVSFSYAKPYGVSFAMKSAKGGINPTRSDEIVITMKSSLREGDIDTPLWGGGTVVDGG